MRLIIEMKDGQINGVFLSNNSMAYPPQVLVINRDPNPDLECQELVVQPLANADKETLDLLMNWEI